MSVTLFSTEASLMCYFARKYSKISIYFANIQTIVFFVCMIEVVIVNYESLNFVDGSIILTAILSSLAFVNYN